MWFNVKEWFLLKFSLGLFSHSARDKIYSIVKDWELNPLFSWTAGYYMIVLCSFTVT